MINRALVVKILAFVNPLSPYKKIFFGFENNKGGVNDTLEPQYPKDLLEYPKYDL
jgi:hypothetical protein